MAFTTWQALYSAMLDRYVAFLSGRSFVVQNYSFSAGSQSQTFTYRSLDELKQGLDHVKALADQESGAAHGRTYAKQGGTGRW